MRKILTTLLLLIIGFSAQGQSIFDIFKSSSEQKEKPKTESPKQFTNESLLGSWSYSKLAVGLADNSPLKGFAGDAAVGQVTKLLNSMAPNVGVVEGMFTVIFNPKGRLVFQIVEGRANGQYKTKVDNQTIDINVGEVNKIEIGKLSAKVTMFESKCTILFDAKDLIAIADKIPSVANNSQYQTVKSVVGSVEGVLLGFTLDKQ